MAVEIVGESGLRVVLLWVVFYNGVIHDGRPLDHIFLVDWRGRALEYLQHAILALIDDLDAFNVLSSNSNLIIILIVIVQVNLRHGADENWGLVIVIDDLLLVFILAT